MTDKIIDDTINIDRRLRIKDRLPGRQDIKDHAANLISYHDGIKTLSQIALPTADYALGRCIARTISAPYTPNGEIAPVGVKLPLLYFSPLYHLHMAITAKQDIVPSSRTALPHLPKTVAELEDHLHQAMGGTFHHNTLFQSVVGVSVKKVAELLFDLKQSNPALFLLLLSLELDLALKIMPSLQYRSGQNPSTAWREKYLADADCKIIEVFQIIRSVRQGTLVIETLAKNRSFSITTVTNLSNEQSKKRSKKVLNPVSVNRSSLNDRDLLRRVNHTVFALRKITCMDIDRHKNPDLAEDWHRFKKQRSDVRTLSSFSCLSGPDTEYSRSVLDDFVAQTAQNLPTAPNPPIIFPEQSDLDVTRLPGSGGVRKDDLATYYGLTGAEVATMTAIEIDNIVRKIVSKSRLALLANAMIEAVGWCEPGASPVRYDHVEKMTKVVKSAFPKKGQFGHCNGFGVSSWQNLERDKALWILLVKSKFSFDPYARQFLEGCRYLMQLTNEVKKLQQLDRSARIFCYLAQSVGLLSGDPIWIRLQERVRVMLQVTLKSKSFKHDRSQSFRAGPKTLGELIAKLEPVRSVRSSNAIH